MGYHPLIEQLHYNDKFLAVYLKTVSQRMNLQFIFLNFHHFKSVYHLKTQMVQILKTPISQFQLVKNLHQIVYR
jgi:hypothetical protein